MESFLLVFIPLFIAIDSVGVLPLFLSITDKFPPAEKKRLALQGVATAFGIGLCFGAAGHIIFSIIGITAADFRIAGGFLLMIFSTREIFGHSDKIIKESTPDNLLGIVPLGIPLIAGPAMITTILILRDQHSLWLIMAALSANLIITLALFVYSDKIIQIVGQGASRVFAKIVAIFLAAIGIMMIRKGLEEVFFR